MWVTSDIFHSILKVNYHSHTTIKYRYNNIIARMAVMALINTWTTHVSYTVNSIPKATRCSILQLNMNTHLCQ